MAALSLPDPHTAKSNFYSELHYAIGAFLCIRDDIGALDWQKLFQ